MCAHCVCVWPQPLFLKGLFPTVKAESRRGTNRGKGEKERKTESARTIRTERDSVRSR